MSVVRTLGLSCGMYLNSCKCNNFAGFLEQSWPGDKDITIVTMVLISGLLYPGSQEIRQHFLRYNFCYNESLISKDFFKNWNFKHSCILYIL